MDRKSFVAGLAVMADTFGRQLGDGAVEGYRLALADMDDSQFSAAVTMALRTCKFMPTPKELRDFAAEHRRKTALETSTRKVLSLAAQEWTPEQKAEAEALVQRLADSKAYPGT